MTRKNLLRLFQNNTGKKQMQMKPYQPTYRNPYGHQRSRVMKFSFQKRDD